MLFFCLKGMDPITRQVGQHIEMEPEWEAAFTLQMKLTHVISMMQDWCALDVSCISFKCIQIFIELNFILLRMNISLKLICL